MKSVAVLAFLLAAASWSPAQIRISRSDLSQDARFGATVLVRDGRVYAGAPGATIGGDVSAGIVYVYDARTGTELGFVRRTLPAANDQFGTSIAIAGNRLFIGAPGRQGPEYGSVFYTSLPVNGFRFTESDFFAPAPDAGSNYGFGSAMAATDDGTIVVGAPDGPAGSWTGKVYFADGLENPPVITDNIAGEEAGARFGHALALTGSTMAIGAPMASSQAGRIFLNGPGGSGFFQPPGLPGFSYFGDSLAASGTSVLVGASDFESDPSRTNSGIAYLVNASSRSVVRRFDAGEIGARFGESVALTPVFAAIGASYSNVSALEGGAAYLFRANLRRNETAVAFPIAPQSLGERDHFGAAIATDGAYLAVGAPETDANGVEDSGAIYVYALAAPRPVVKPKPKVAGAAGTRTTIKGVATRGFHAIAVVEYSLKRGGKYKPLRGTKRWRGAVKISDSTRSIFVRAYDAAGTASRIAVVRLRR